MSADRITANVRLDECLKGFCDSCPNRKSGSGAVDFVCTCDCHEGTR